MKKALALILTLAMMTGVMGGCSQKPAGNPSTSTPPASTSTDTPAGPAAPAAGEIPNTFNYEAVENTTGKEIRIAVLTTQTNAFWVDVCQGTEDVKAFLGQDKYICTVGVADSIASSISKAVAAGIPVYLFNSNTGVDNEATAFVGQDLYGAGEKLGGILAGMVGQGGKVGIITGLYSGNAFTEMTEYTPDTINNYFPE